MKIRFQNQCCGAGAGGAEIILRPGAGADIILIINIFAVSLEDARMKKSSFLPLIVSYYYHRAVLRGNIWL